MRKLFAVLGLMLLLFALSMAGFAAAAYTGRWLWAVLGAAAGLVFLAAGPLLPRAQKRVPYPDKRQAMWLVQLFGATLATLFLTAALFAWIMGNRTYSEQSGYQVLGLLIFLALLGVGAQGIMATTLMYVGTHSQRENDKRALRARAAAVAEHH